MLIVASCGTNTPSNGPAPRQTESAPTGIAAEAVPPKTLCAPAGAADFERICDRELEDGVLTIRHPDGGFRRFEIVSDGRGLVAADGAAPARVSTVGSDMIEVSIEADRYRLPAKVER